MSILQQTTNLPQEYDLEPTGRRSTWDKTYLGFVRDKDDQQKMGRLMVYIPELCGDIDNPDTWILVDYATPFGGATSITESTRNPGSSQTSYGFWAVPPDLDNQVLVMFINGDPNRGFWFACLYQVNVNRMVPTRPGNSRTGLDASKLIDSPAPLGSRGITNIGVGASVPDVDELGITYPDDAVAAHQIADGQANDPVVGPPSVGASNSYQTYGFSTPSGNRFSMIDEPGATEIRIASRNNLQIVLHNETGKIVISTGGNSRIELSKDGDIEIYGKGNISVASESDLNLHANRDVNINAGGLLQIRSGGDMNVFSTGQMNMFSNSNMMLTSKGEMHRVSNGHIYDTTMQRFYRRANFSIFDSVNGGDIHVYANGGVLVTATDTINAYAINSINAQSISSEVNVKAGSNINQQADGMINIKSGSEIKVYADADLSLKSGSSVNVQGNGDVNLLAGSGSVITGPDTIINGNPSPAGSADDAKLTSNAMEAEYGTAARQPNVISHVVQDTRNSVGGERTQRIITSVASYVPSGDPAPTRVVRAPGYSNTGTVEINENAPKLKIGQIIPEQTVPLQVMGYVGTGASLSLSDVVPQQPTSFGSGGGSGGASANAALNTLNQPIREAAEEVLRTYPGARLTSAYRPGDPRQHGSRNAADFTLDALSEGQRQALVNGIVNGMRSGSGPYGKIRGIGMYETSGRRLHIDVRERNASGVVNGFDFWGPSYSRASISQTPPWFQQAVLQLVQGTPRNILPSTIRPVTSGNGTPTRDKPMRYTGVGYSGQDNPIYVAEDVASAVFKMSGEYTLSSTGLLEIQNFETMRGPRPDDIQGKMFENVCGGVMMIGFGHRLTANEIDSSTVVINGRNVSIENGITENDATELLKADLAPIEAAVKSGISTEITQQQYDALVDFVWNIGVEKWRQSDVLKAVNDKNYDSVPNEMMRWTKACGEVKADLIARRTYNAQRWAGQLRAETSITYRGDTGTVSASITGEGAQRAMNWFQSSTGGNYSCSQAAGIVANLIIESRLNPGAVNTGDPTQAHGLAQWTNVGNRRGRVESYLGKPVLQASFDEQLRAISWELNGSEAAAGRGVRAATTPQDAAAAFCRLYERPGNVQAEIARRSQQAAALANQYCGLGTPTTQVPRTEEGEF